MAKKLLLLGLLGLACGGADGAPGAAGSSCTVTENADGSATILCDDGTSATIAGTPGPSGADGEDGSDGAPGTPGADGSDTGATKIVESFHCGGPIAETALTAFYDAVLLSSGDMFVTGTVRTPLIGSSTSVLYSPNQNGYNAAEVFVSLDADETADGGYFVLSLNRLSLVQVVHYLGSGTEVTQSWSMAPESCVHNFY